MTEDQQRLITREIDFLEVLISEMPDDLPQFSENLLNAASAHVRRARTAKYVTSADGHLIDAWNTYRDARNIYWARLEKTS